MDPAIDLAVNNAYNTPFKNNPILTLLLLSLSQQRNAPKVKNVFRQEYDYIVVGAGSAGSVVASRLSEIPCVSVLLLEAGKSPPLLNDVPVLARNFWFSDLDWQYKTVPQRHTGFGLVNNQVVWPSGKGLGGSSLLNGMLYVRGNRRNYDDWAAHGAVGWSYSDVKPYFLKLEDNRDPEYLANGYHAVDGPVSVHKPRYEAEIKKPLLETAKLLGYKVLDANGRRQSGFYDHQGTFRNGQRCSTAKAYLVPAENRTNLDIVTNAFVRKVVIQDCRAVGVEFEFGGAVEYVRARREVILSAGAVNTPQLLMLSGIGPREQLKSFGITVEQNLPVGENLQDHCAVPMPFQINRSIPSILEKAKNPRSFQQYVQNRTGVFTSSEGVSLMAFINGPAHPSFDEPDAQIYFAETPPIYVKEQFGLTPEAYQATYGPYENSTMYVCLAQVLHPRSRGTVRLQSADPHQPPLIDPNYFAAQEDIRDVGNALKTCLRIGSSVPMRRVGSRHLSNLVPGCEEFSKDIDRYVECVARTIIVTTSHPVGTVKMGDKNDPYTVVDPLLRVKGVEALRVVDASVMPTIPYGNTNVPTIMIAEKASDIIKTTICCYAQEPVLPQNDLPTSPYFNKPPVNPITVT